MPENYLHGVEVVAAGGSLRPVTAGSTSVVFMVGTAPFADPVAFPLDRPVAVLGPAQAALLTKTMPANAAAGAEGTLAAAVAAVWDQARTPIVVVRVEVAAAGATQEADQLTLVTGVQAEGSGAYGALTAESLTGLKPKILIAPGFTHQEPGAAANPVAAALNAAAVRLRAIPVTDGPSDTDAAAFAKAARDGARAYPIDPFILRQGRTAIARTPASATIAGRIARTDAELGVWHSPSNKELVGVLGLDRPITFGLNDAATSANLLNEKNVATIVNVGGSYRLWGNRLANGEFISQRRTLDWIYDRIEARYLEALDRPLNAQTPVELINAIDADFRTMRGLGAIIGGRAYFDPELNTVEAFKAGRLYIDIDPEPPTPLERLTVRAFRNDGYYEETARAIAQAVA
jgi:hypothetical protein